MKAKKIFMKKLINFILVNIFLSQVLVSNENSNLSFIKANDPSLIKIKDFLEHNKYKYSDLTLYDITQEIDLNLQMSSESLEVYFFKIDDQILVPFITKNFNKFVHKDLMLKITKFLYKHVISDVEIFPFNKCNSSNMQLFTYPNEKEVLLIIPLVSVRFK